MKRSIFESNMMLLSSLTACWIVLMKALRDTAKPCQCLGCSGAPLLIRKFVRVVLIGEKVIDYYNCNYIYYKLHYRKIIVIVVFVNYYFIVGFFEI